MKGFFKKKISFIKRREDGVVLIDVALLLLLGGLMIGGFVAALRPVDRETQTEDTRAKMQKVTYAMAIHVQRNGYLPCPADPAGSGPEPFGAERGSGIDGTGSGKKGGACDTNNMDEAVGIVPFKTLGLMEDDAKDEWGHYFTYRTTIFAGDLPTKHEVHDVCRETDVWVFKPKNGPFYNINPEKAYFCCSRSEAGFTVTNKDGDDYITELANCQNNHGACGGKYGAIDKQAQSTSIKSSDLPDILAMVLVSHGRNGFGSFMRNGERYDWDNRDQYSDAEIENADHENDSEFVMIAPNREADSNYFDDIVMWRTQQGIFNELGGNYSGCSAPKPGLTAPEDTKGNSKNSKNGTDSGTTDNGVGSPTDGNTVVTDPI